MNYQPFGTGVLLQLPDIAETTDSGLIKGAAVVAQEQATWDSTFKVVAVGKGCSEVTVGMSVYLRPDSDVSTIKVKGDPGKYMQVDQYCIVGYLNN